MIFISYYTLFLASFIILFYLTYRINAGYRKPRAFVEEEHLGGFVDEGVVILPTEVREGESHSISLDLTLSKDFTSCDYLCKSNDYLEAELQAPGLNVDGEKRLRIFETSCLSIISWTCHFPTSGVQTITLMIRVVKSNNSRHVIFMQRRNIKVNSLMNISWLPMAMIMAPILAAVVQVLLKIR
jgi:hypothetical protein